MCFAQWKVTIHEDMQFDGIMIANASGAQFMGVRHARHRGCQSKYLCLYLIGQRLLHQIADADSKQVERYFHDEETHNDRSYGIEHCPPFAQEDGATDTDGRTNRRHSITSVVPGIGLHSLRIELTCLHHRIAESGFLEYDRQQGSP